MRRRTTGSLALLGLALAQGLGSPARPQGLEDFPYTRAVEVERPGLVRVGLDFEALRRLTPGARHVLVFDPNGREIAAETRRAIEGEALRRAHVVGVEQVGTGWWVRIDTGNEPWLHRRLVWELTEQVLAPGALLESSIDGSTWHLLAEGDLFRLGDDGTSKLTSLEYEASGDRFLRLWWPLEAGFPKVEAVLLETLPERLPEQYVTEPDCEELPRRQRVCRLPLGAPGARRLELEPQGSGVTGYRLAMATAGAWITLSEGTWTLSERPNGPRILAVAGLESSALRLELFGTGTTPSLRSYRVEYQPASLLFRAESSGTYTLGLGATRPSLEGALGATPGDRAAATWVEAGPETVQPRRTLPQSAISPAQPLPDVRFAESWSVVAPKAEPGELLRLDLPEVFYEATAGKDWQMRLSSGSRQVPFLTSRAPEPVLVTEVDLRLSATEDGRSRGEIHLPSARLPGMQLELTTSEGPFRRQVRGRFVSPRRPGVPDRDLWSVRWTQWTCRKNSPLTCALTLPLSSSDGDRFLLEIEDGDNAPLGNLTARIWRSRDVLIFAWPEREPVTLLAGSPGLHPARYDLELLSEEVLAQPWQPATLDLAVTAGRRAEQARVGRWGLTAALVIAGLLLVALLGRLVTRREPESPGS